MKKGISPLIAAVILIAFVIAVAGIASTFFTGFTKEPKEQGCLDSGGAVVMRSCCKSVGDFPNLCGIGACGCAPENSHRVKVCLCGEGRCFNGESCGVIDFFEEA